MRSSSPNNSTPSRPQSRWRIRLPLAPPSTRVVFPRATTIAGVKLEIEEALNAGNSAVCPITGKIVEIYRRGLHQGQVSTLRRLARASTELGKSFLHLKYFTSRRDGDFSKLVAWGLIEALKPATKLEAEKCRGFWKITDLGRRWLAGRCAIPRQMAIVNNTVIGPVDAKKLVKAKDVPKQFKRELLDEGRDGYRRRA